MSEKQVCLLTGASGGLGRAILQRLLENGYCVVATDLRADQTKEVVQDITGRSGVNSDRILAMALDVRSMKAWSSVWKRAIARFGAIDILINNAGVLQPCSGDVCLQCFKVCRALCFSGCCPGAS